MVVTGAGAIHDARQSSVFGQFATLGAKRTILGSLLRSLESVVGLGAVCFICNNFFCSRSVRGVASRIDGKLPSTR